MGLSITYLPSSNDCMSSSVKVIPLVFFCPKSFLLLLSLFLFMLSPLFSFPLFSSSFIFLMLLGSLFSLSPLSFLFGGSASFFGEVSNRLVVFVALIRPSKQEFFLGLPSFFYLSHSLWVVCVYLLSPCLRILDICIYFFDM